MGGLGTGVLIKRDSPLGAVPFAVGVAALFVRFICSMMVAVEGKGLTPGLSHI